eukprot:gene53-3449_t
MSEDLSSPARRENKSLTNITKEFVRILQNQPDASMSVLEVEKHLRMSGTHFSRRRLSDVINVLEGIGVIERKQIQPRMYLVQLVASASDPDLVKKKQLLNDEVRSLSFRERNLNDSLEQCASTFKSLKDHFASQYILSEDLVQISQIRNGLSFFIPSVDGMHLSLYSDLRSHLAKASFNCVRARYTDPFTVQVMIQEDQPCMSPKGSHPYGEQPLACPLIETDAHEQDHMQESHKLSSVGYDTLNGVSIYPAHNFDASQVSSEAIGLHKQRVSTDELSQVCVPMQARSESVIQPRRLCVPPSDESDEGNNEDENGDYIRSRQDMLGSSNREQRIILSQPLSTTVSLSMDLNRETDLVSDKGNGKRSTDSESCDTKHSQSKSDNTSPSMIKYSGIAQQLRDRQLLVSKNDNGICEPHQSTQSGQLPEFGSPDHQFSKGMTRDPHNNLDFQRKEQKEKQPVSPRNTSGGSSDSHEQPIKRSKTASFSYENTPHTSKPLSTHLSLRESTKSPSKTMLLIELPSRIDEKEYTMILPDSTEIQSLFIQD